mgnify:CR=1 FL=1
MSPKSRKTTRCVLIGPPTDFSAEARTLTVLLSSCPQACIPQNRVVAGQGQGGIQQTRERRTTLRRSVRATGLRCKAVMRRATRAERNRGYFARHMSGLPLPSWKSELRRSGHGREVVMLTRRGFAGFASCAICAVTGFVATDASAAGGALPAAVALGVTGKDELSDNRWRRVAHLPMSSINARRCPLPTRVRPPGERI